VGGPLSAPPPPPAAAAAARGVAGGGVCALLLAPAARVRPLGVLRGCTLGVVDEPRFARPRCHRRGARCRCYHGRHRHLLTRAALLGPRAALCALPSCSASRVVAAQSAGREMWRGEQGPACFWRRVSFVTDPAAITTSGVMRGALGQRSAALSFAPRHQRGCRVAVRAPSWLPRHPMVSPMAPQRLRWVGRTPCSGVEAARAFFPPPRSPRGCGWAKPQHLSGTRPAAPGLGDSAGEASLPCNEGGRDAWGGTGGAEVAPI